MVNDEADGDTGDDATDEHAAEREEITDSELILGPIVGAIRDVP
jgi:hypothetical protein